MTLRLAFMGTPDFAVPALRALVAAGQEIACVYSQPPRPAGRGLSEKKSPVHRAADGLGIPVRTPKSLNNPEEQNAWQALDLDLAVVAAYGLILPKVILDAPKYGCINIHASLLPRWRGAAPIQRAIMAGDHETGISIMQMAEGLDTGAVLLSAAVPILAEDTAGSLHDKLADLGAKLIIDGVNGIEAGKLIPVPQPEAGVTYAKKINKAEARIDWAESAQEIDRKVRGLSPFPGAWLSYKKRRIKCLYGTPEDGKNTAGFAVDDRLGIACGEGIYRILKLQREGKAAMTAKDFLKGFPIPKGEQME